MWDRHKCTRLTLSLLLLLALAAGRPLLPQARQPQAGPPPTSYDNPWREPLSARRGMVSSGHPLASRVGVEVLRRGGNAVEAAVAVALALAVVYPEAGNLGGGGFMLVRMRDGRTSAIDYRETAPAAATRNMFLDARGALIQGEGSATRGYRASATPGTVAGLELALKKYGSGRLSWAQLVEPARRLAAEGFELPYWLVRSLRSNAAKLNAYADSRRIFLEGGAGYEEGDVLRQPELAATLARLQRGGPREFYEGRTASLIVSDMKRHGGLLTAADMRGYKAKERVPLRGSYRGHEILTMPPPSAGGIVLLEMLNILEGYDLRGMGPSSSEKYHLLAEAMRRGYADRAEYMGDTDFVKFNVEKLVSKEYAAERRGTISTERASTSREVGGGLAMAGDGPETTHFTILDGEGNAVANTYTINDLYGSGVTAAGTGVLLNNIMDDFTTRPDTPNLWGAIQGRNNVIEPGKRPLSSMTPTIVLDKSGGFWFGVGARGGTRITNAVLQIIINVIDHGMNIQQALDAPRIHHQWLPDVLLHEPFGMSADTQRALEARGHKVAQATGPSNVAGADAVLFDRGAGRMYGASDPRRFGQPAGY